MQIWHFQKSSADEETVRSCSALGEQQWNALRSAVNTAVCGMSEFLHMKSRLVLRSPGDHIPRGHVLLILQCHHSPSPRHAGSTWGHRATECDPFRGTLARCIQPPTHKAQLWTLQCACVQHCSFSCLLDTYWSPVDFILLLACYDWALCGRLPSTMGKPSQATVTEQAGCMQAVGVTQCSDRGPDSSLSLSFCCPTFQHTTVWSYGDKCGNSYQHFWENHEYVEDVLRENKRHTYISHLFF